MADPTPTIEFIPNAGACLATLNVLERRGKVRWMTRLESSNPADNGWQIISEFDDSDYLNNTDNWRVADFNDLCMIEPALIGIWNFPVGSQLEIVRDDLGIGIIDNRTGYEVPEDQLYVPPSQRA